MMPERVVCGCGTVLPLHAYRRERTKAVLYWLTTVAFAPVESKDEAVRLLEYGGDGSVLHRCGKRSWPKGARMRLESEPTVPVPGPL